MPDYKIGSHVRVSEAGIERIGTVIGYADRNQVLIADDELKSITDTGLVPYVWHVIPTDDLTIVPLGDDNF
jgi:hypothetical protein